MKKSLRDLVKLSLPMSGEKRSWLDHAAQHLEPDDQAILREYLKTDRCFAVQQRLGTALFPEVEWPLFKSHLRQKEVDEFLHRTNEAISEGTKERAFRAFAPQALERIPLAIGPNIVGHETSKRAVALQLFATEPYHVLLIGDPGTGKTDLLRSLHDLAPVASFGLGSGVSGVGLSAVAKGDELLKGLLPLADGGIACIDELNLIKAKDLAALYNAMEKGFVSYDKGSKHETLPAKVRVCATANPSTQTFVGQTAEVLRKQVPFGDALLSRFNLVFVIRKPSEEEFAQITRRVVAGASAKVSAGDAAFVKEYARHAERLMVTLPQEIEQRIIALVRELKRDERKFLTEVGPRTATGIVRMVKAAARAELTTQAGERHFAYASKIVREALYRGDQ